jgi:hypothetical protein
MHARRSVTRTRTAWTRCLLASAQRSSGAPYCPSSTSHSKVRKQTGVQIIRTSQQWTSWIVNSAAFLCFPLNYLITSPCFDSAALIPGLPAGELSTPLLAVRNRTLKEVLNAASDEDKVGFSHCIHNLAMLAKMHDCSLRFCMSSLVSLYVIGACASRRAAARA